MKAPLCSGASERQLRAIEEAIRETAHKFNVSPAHTEGKAEAGWILMDLGDLSQIMRLKEIAAQMDLTETVAWLRRNFKQQ